MKTVKAWLLEHKNDLNNVSSEPEQELLWLIEAVFQKQAHLVLDTILEAEQETLLNSMLVRRQNNEPLQYIIGSVPFLDLTIFVEPPLLIPRPETEEWTAWLVTKIKNEQSKIKNILDLCSGTGCIALALAKKLPQAHVTAVDINSQAMKLIQKNAQQNNIANITILEGDFFNPVKKKKYDLIVCNPPYLSKLEYQSLDATVKTWEDSRALSDLHDGLTFYRKLALEGKEYLTHFEAKLPRIVCEIGYLQADSVQQIFLEAGWKTIIIHKDLAGHPRWISAYDNANSEPSIS